MRKRSFINSVIAERARHRPLPSKAREPRANSREPGAWAANRDSVSARAARCGFRGRVVFWFLYLFTHGGENLPDPALAKVIGDKWWNKSARVGIDRVSSASSGRAARFEQPRPLAELNTDNARLLRRAQCVRRFPAVRIDKSSDAWPGGFVGAEREIPITTNLGRNSLVAQERVAFAPKESALCHVRHEARIKHRHPR